MQNSHHIGSSTCTLLGYEILRRIQQYNKLNLVVYVAFRKENKNTDLVVKIWLFLIYVCVKLEEIKTLTNVLRRRRECKSAGIIFIVNPSILLQEWVGQ